MVIASGGTLLVESGATLNIEDGALEAPDIALVQGSVLVGDSNGEAAALVAKGDAKMLIGNGTTITSAVMSGDAGLANNGALTLTVPVIKNIRSRCTLSEINAGKELLAQISGYKYRLINCKAIAYGGNVGAVTTVDVLGDQSGSVVLVAFAQASLTQSTVLTAGASGAAVLADGASYVANDANTAITVIKNGSDVTTATGVDIILTYTIEAA